MIDELKGIIGKKVCQLFLVVWPPLGESDVSPIDISAGYIFDNVRNKLFVISTDKNDLTTPQVKIVSIPHRYFAWQEFEDRMKRWIKCDTGMVLGTEYYDVSNADLFQDIVNHNVLDIELIRITNEDVPLGTKLVFHDDYILSSPVNDGNTIETRLFNRNDNLNNFTPLGELEFVSVKHANIIR